MPPVWLSAGRGLLSSAAEANSLYKLYMKLDLHTMIMRANLELSSVSFSHLTLCVHERFGQLTADSRTPTN